MEERFEILERLGAGGMGEVFRARDRKLNRFVALKFLPVSANNSARERFEREAQVIAALNHPNICTLFETGEQEGRPFLVLELLEGETLKARLRRGPLHGEHWTEAALEIAEALDAAHRRSILHRDLKPDNIWLTTSGHTKVLDFGLAKMQGEALSEAVTVAGPMDADGLTRPGMTMGTFPYMSPEQARGEELDARSDLFSLGAVLYEMASGKAAFPSRTSSETMAAILRDQPVPLEQVRPELPSDMTRIVARCLEKDRDLRYQSAADLRADLKRLKRGSQSSASAVPASSMQTPVAAQRGGAPWPWYAMAALIIVAGLVFWLLRPAVPSGPPQLQFRQITFNGHVQDAAISRDGRFLAYTEATPKGPDLRLLNIPTSSDVEIVSAGGTCCADPTFSPDGNYVYYLTGNQIDAVPVLGGSPRLIVSQADSGAGFSPDGKQLAFIRDDYPRAALLMVAQADGTGAHQVAEVRPPYFYACANDSAGTSPDAPAWSPEGKHLAVDRFRISPLAENLVVVTLANGAMQALGPDQLGGFSDLAWQSSGSGIVGTAAPAGEGADGPEVLRYAYPSGKRTQWTNDLQGYANITMSGNGELALLHASPQASVWRAPSAGAKAVELPGGGDDMAGANGLAWTPQGKILTNRIEGGQTQLWEETADGADAHEIAMPGLAGLFSDPHVAPNGQIVLHTLADKLLRVWRVNADGSGATVLSPGMLAQQPVVIRGGKEVAFLVLKQKAQYLYVVPLSGGIPHLLYSQPINSVSAAASPDGSKMLVIGRQGPTLLDVSGEKVKATVLKNFPPQPWGRFDWTPDGKAVTYVKATGLADNIWAWPIAGGVPRELTHFTDLSIKDYAFSRDGRLAASRGQPNSNVVIATRAVH